MICYGLMGVSSLVLFIAGEAHAAVPGYDHVVIVMEENHSYTQITSTYAASAPYINNTLVGSGARFTKFYGEEHASEGNYLWMFSGSNFNIGYNDPCPVGPFASANLGASLISAGYSFKGYSEDLPSIGSTICTSGAYARKHNPWVNFSNVPNGTAVATSSNLRVADFPSDYSTLPTVSVVVPNQNNDMHNGTNPTTVATADTWLQNHLDGYYQWAKTHNSLLIVTFDESNGGSQGLTNPGVGDNQILTVFAGAGIAHASYAEGAGVNHVNMLRTLEDMYALPHAGAQTSLATTAGLGSGAITDVYTQWKVNSDGDWWTPSNWNQNAVPSGVGAVANLFGAIDQPRTISVSAPLTINVLNIDNAAAYELAGSATVSLDATAGFYSRINVVTGSHHVSAPLALLKDTSITVGPSASLTASNLSTTSAAITKAGAGSFAVNAVRAGALAITGGTVSLLSNGTDAAVSRVGSLSIAGGASPTAALDLADNDLIVDYSGASPVATIQNQIKAAYASGAWTGPGITSRAALAAAGSTFETGLGYGEASDVYTSFPADFVGQSVDSTTVLVRYTLKGDANLDGSVDTVDFNIVATYFGRAGRRWTHGDFDYNSFIDTTDFNYVATNFGQALPASAGAGTLIPEPASGGLIMMLAVSAGAGLRRRGRNCRA
jgi:acid phosphatase